MKKIRLGILWIVAITVIGACGQKEVMQDNVIHIEETNQVEEYITTIELIVDQHLEVNATLTYVGEKAEQMIYHGGEIFHYEIVQQDGDFEYTSPMNLPLLTTTLAQNEAHSVTFDDIKLRDLVPGTYEFSIIANFSLNDDFSPNIKVPVSAILTIEEE
ncbi:lipoprotein [Bacillus alkalicellulosilyticus]|uniref:LptM family lipoprotein n=1 Tax=Alkalihalobacterium alkalicellulosilyticum TaxID=1912214 RepID=UPI00099887EB|nr:hypothetical protein [Bacillus alkalicellulosilyticus]